MTTSADIYVSDTHIGSKFSIMHPINAADYSPNKLQQWLFKVWRNNFLGDIERILDEYKPEYVHLNELGDMGELDFKRHNPEEVWTRNSDDIVSNHASLFEPLYVMVDSVDVVRGTKAHIGEDGGIDEKIANDIAILNPTSDLKSDKKPIAAGWYSEYTLSGVLFDIAHHGKNRTKWTEINGLVSLGKEIILKRVQKGEKIPDVVARGHYHYGNHTPFDIKPYVISVPSWQLPNTFVYRIDPTVETPHVGGHVVIARDGKVIAGIRLIYTYPRKAARCLQK